MFYKFVVTNTGPVTLTNLTLTDASVNSGDAVSTASCVLPSSLAPNASFTCVVGPVKARTGQHTDTGKATGQYNSITVQDTDDANYYGQQCDYCSGDTTKYKDSYGSYQKCSGSSSGGYGSYSSISGYYYPTRSRYGYHPVRLRLL